MSRKIRIILALVLLAAYFGYQQFKPEPAAGTGAQQTGGSARMQLPHRLFCRHGMRGPGRRVCRRRGLRAVQERPAPPLAR